MGVLNNCLVGALPYTLRDTIIPLVRSKASPPRTNDLNRSQAVTDRQKTKGHPVCLAHVLSGMSHSVVVN